MNFNKHLQDMIGHDYNKTHPNPSRDVQEELDRLRQEVADRKAREEIERLRCELERPRAL